MNIRVKMSDPLIEGITNPEPKPGIMTVVDSLREHLLPANADVEGVDDKRESLAILASLGTAKDYLGVQFESR